MLLLTLFFTFLQIYANFNNYNTIRMLATRCKTFWDLLFVGFLKSIHHSRYLTKLNINSFYLSHSVTHRQYSAVNIIFIAIRWVDTTYLSNFLFRNVKLLNKRKPFYSRDVNWYFLRNVRSRNSSRKNYKSH